MCSSDLVIAVDGGERQWDDVWSAREGAERVKRPSDASSVIGVSSGRGGSGLCTVEWSVERKSTTETNISVCMTDNQLSIMVNA